ncbi:MAG: glycosyltransferase, partial [Bacteroidia bacterium]|nr:glycosyltransferase [Bacteroidia bacterium]
VDDGSPDNCGNMCDEWAKLDSRIKVIHKKNGGLSSARNSGYELSSGRYISFIDSDDSILPGMYSDMILQLEKNSLDIIDCLAQVVKEDRTKTHLSDGSLLILDKINALNYCIENEKVSVCSKIFTRKAIGQVRFPEGRVYEDTACMYLFINNCDRVGYMSKTYYNYYFNPSSISKTAFNTKARFDFVLSTKEVFEFAEKNNLLCVPKAKGFYIRRLLSCLTAIYAHGVCDDNQEYYDFISEEIIKYRNSDCYSLVNGKYKLFLYSFGRYNFIHKMAAKLSKIWRLF